MNELDPQTQGRVAYAREALAEWEAFLRSEDPNRPVDLQVVSKLVTCTRWLVEQYTGEQT
jgi:hypothetical protein